MSIIRFCLLVGAAMYGGLLAYCLMMAEINALLFVVWNSIAAGLVIMSVQMQWGLVAESIDYNEYLTGKRNEGEQGQHRPGKYLSAVTALLW